MKKHRCISSATWLVVVVVLLIGCNKNNSHYRPANGGDQSFRFVFLADSRGDSTDHLVNDSVLGTIVSKIVALQPKPAFVMFGGDMSYRGHTGSSYTYDAWKTIFAPLADSGIALYTALGNHELYRDPDNTWFCLANQQEYQRAFSSNPDNGPAGYEHLVYSFTDISTNSLFAVLDPYYMSQDSAKLKLGGNIDTTQMAWLKALVSQSNASHKFLFNHAPYYYVSNDPEEPSEANKTYTELWEFLDNNNFDLYLCGHQHLYSRKTIDKDVAADPALIPPTNPWKNNVVQLLNGTCGAYICTENIHPGIRYTWHVFNAAANYYFSVIDIIGNTVKVTSYKGCTGDYSVVDTCSVTR
jgi:hypothetical protein